MRIRKVVHEKKDRNNKSSRKDKVVKARNESKKANFMTLSSSLSSNSGVLTPVDPPSRVGSAVIATDPAMEVDKAETILIKQVVRLASCLIM